MAPDTYNEEKKNDAVDGKFEPVDADEKEAEDVGDQDTQYRRFIQADEVFFCRPVSETVAENNEIEV